jgi:hypothetical protein
MIDDGMYKKLDRSLQYNNTIQTCQIEFDTYKRFILHKLITLLYLLDTSGVFITFTIKICRIEYMHRRFATYKRFILHKLITFLY